MYLLKKNNEYNIKCNAHAAIIRTVFNFFQLNLISIIHIEFTEEEIKFKWKKSLKIPNE